MQFDTITQEIFFSWVMIMNEETRRRHRMTEKWHQVTEKIDVIDHNVMNDGRVRDYPTLSWYFVAPYLESISWHQSQTPTNHTLYEKNKAEIMCMKKNLEPYFEIG